MTISATTVIRTSFEGADGYAVGTIAGRDHWTISSGSAMVSTVSEAVHSGQQGLLLSATDKLQVGHIPYSKSQSGLDSLVYIDMYLRVNQRPSSNFSITTYDLTGNHRSAMIELTSAGKLKVYNGSSGYTSQPAYQTGEWMRLSLCIDHSMHQYQFALNGQVWPQRMNFREIKNGATDIDYHELRFAVSGSTEIAIDELSIGSDSIAGIYFLPSLPQDTTPSLPPTTPSVPVPDDAVRQTRYVSNVTALKNALAAMNPGDSIILADGTYNMGGVSLRRTGTEAAPIVIIAEHPHEAHIIGTSSMTLRYVAYIEINGLDWNLAHVSTIIKMEGCNHVRLTGNKMTMDAGTDGQTSKWILIGDVYNENTCISHHNRIDHNLIYDKLDGGAWLVIDGTHGTPHISQHDRIDHNIFRNNTPRMNNEKETIRMGVSDLSNLNAYTVVEDNTFEDCDGDPEIVSVKSCADTVRNNTFIRCLGTVCLRQGWNSVVTANHFDGEHKTAIYNDAPIGCGGVRIYGKGHEVSYNEFTHLTGSKWDAAITLTNGDITNTGAATSSHPIPENVRIHHNIFEDNVSNVEVGFTNNGNYSRKPQGCSFYENTFVGSDTLVTYHTPMTSTNLLWYDNHTEQVSTAVETSQSADDRPRKVLIDGQLYILYQGRKYTILGQ